MQSEINDVRRIESIDRSQFQREYAAKGKPFVLTTSQRTRAAAAKWDLNYLAGEQGHIRVTVEYYPDGDRNKPSDHQAMTVNDYVEKIRNASERHKYYLAEELLSRVLPDLAKEVPRPSFIEEEDKPVAVVFIGVDSYTGFHYHVAPTEAFLMQISGTKRVLLVSRERYRSLYPRGWFRARHNWSRTALNPGGGRELLGSMLHTMLADGRYPKAANVPIVDCVLQEGEGLFIPQGWFHAVYGVGESISITHFFTGSRRHAHPPILVRDSLAMMRKRWISRPLKRMARLLPRSSSIY